MRKLIIIVVAMLTPFAMWTAGCRQNKSTSAAFPKGPEVKGLARASEQKPGVPEIAAAPAAIDPEVLHTPDQPTFARIRAVMDREAQMSSRDAAPGLFVMPRQDVPELAVLPEPVPAQSAPAPQFANREFRSRPMTPVPGHPNQYRAAGGDVSAMMPPAQPRASVPFEPALPMEAIPGVYMGTDQAADMPAATPGPLGGPLPMIGMVDNKEKSEAMSAPPLLSTTAFEAVSVDDLNALMRELGVRQSPADREAGATPAQSRPSFAQAPEAPDASPRLTALLNNDIHQALAPLPSLVDVPSSPAPSADMAFSAPETPKAHQASAPVLTASAPMDDLAAAVRKAAAEFMPAPPAESPKAPAAAKHHDPLLAEFWDAKLPEIPPLLDFGVAAVPETKIDVAVDKPAVPAQTLQAAAPKNPAPQKVTLTPLPEKSGARSAKIDSIDSSVEVPPLRF